MTIDELICNEVYYFEHSSSEYKKYNYICRYKGDYLVKSFIQPEIKCYTGRIRGPEGKWWGCYTPATPNQIAHLLLCEGANKYVEFNYKTNNEIKNEVFTMKKMQEVLEKVYSNLDLRRKVVPLFIGQPGLGKTVMIEDFARKKGVQLVELITSQMSPFEVSGICIPHHESGLMKYYNLDKLENLKDGDILFFDELLNGNPVVLNACLTILEQRRFISGKPLPDIMIVAAANPQGMAPLTPQIKERFIWYDVKFDLSLWSKYMREKYHMTTNMTCKLGALIKTEEFTGSNFYTPRSIEKAVQMIIHDCVTPYKEVVLPILSEMIPNKFKEYIELPNGDLMMPDENILWLDLIKMKLNIKVNETIRVEETETA